MGRLIDADLLKTHIYRIDDSATLSTRDVVNEEDIDDAPTVDAIPRERIKQMETDIDEMQAWGDNFGNVYLSYDKVKEIIHKYTKEQNNGKTD